MEPKSLEELLGTLRSGGETTSVEAKRAEKISESVLETVSAFSNEPGLGGGYLLLGVENKGSTERPDYRISGLVDAEKLESDLASQCRNEMSSSVRPRIHRQRHGDLSVIIAYIPEADRANKPVYIKKRGIQHGSFRRIGPTDQRCTEDDLSVLFQGRDASPTDRSPVQGTSISDIDPRALKEYRRLKKNTQYAGELLALSNERLLKCLNATVEYEGRVTLTLAGLVLFGKFTAIRQHLPMMRLDYIQVTGRDWVADPAARHETLEKIGPLFLIIPELIDRVLENVPRKFTLREDQVHREDAPLIPKYALREAIVNAAMHRSYKKHGPTQIIRFANRIEIINPGCSIVREEQWGQQGSSLTRNPTIAAVLHDVGLAENKGTGIAAMRKAMQRSHLSPPLFESDRQKDIFVARFLLHQLLDENAWRWLSAFAKFGLSDDDASALCVARQLGVVNNWLYRELTGVDTLTASGRLAKLRDHGLLEKQGKGYNTIYKLSVPAESASRIAGLETGSEDEASARLTSREVMNRGSEPLNPLNKGQVESATLPDKTLPRGVNPSDKAQSGGWNPSDKARLGESEDIPGHLRAVVDSLGSRATTEAVEAAILAFCQWRTLSAQQIARLLKRRVTYIQNRYLKALVAAGRLKYLYPDNPAHPGQAYRAVSKSELEN